MIIKSIIIIYIYSTILSFFYYFAKNASAQGFKSVNLFLWKIYLPKLSKQTDSLE